MDDEKGNEVKPAAPSVIVVGGGKGGRWVSILTGAVVVGGVIGIGIWLWNKLSGGEDLSGDIELSVEALQENVAAGDEVAVNVSVTNIGEDTIEPRIRFDLKQGTGGWTGVNENPDGFISFGEIESGETITKQMSMTVPADWTAGTVIYGRLVLSGHEGTVWTDQIARIPTAADLQIISVDPVSVNVAKGYPAQVDMVVDNPNAIAFQASYALDLKGSATWTEGDYQTFDIQPGQSTVRLISKAVPLNWSGVIAAKVMVRVMIGGVWSAKFTAWGDVAGSTQYQIFNVAGTPAQAYLYITSRGASGLSNKCVAVGTPFSYTIDYNNVSDQAISADFIVGLRTQAAVGTYVEKRVTKTLQPGSGTITVNSITPGSSWSGYVLDMRVLVAQSAQVIVTNDQGEVVAEDGTLTDLIWEDDQVVYVGVSKLSPLKDGLGNTYLRITQTPLNGVVSSGDPVSVTLGVYHIGPAKSYKFGTYFKTNVDNFWIQKTAQIPEHVTPTQFQVTVTGTFVSSLPSGRGIDIYNAVCEANQALATSGMLIGDPDAEVFHVE